jgi:hypothetical protein
MCSWELSHKPFNLSTERLGYIRNIARFNNWDQKAISNWSFDGGVVIRESVSATSGASINGGADACCKTCLYTARKERNPIRLFQTV